MTHFKAKCTKLYSQRLSVRPSRVAATSIRRDGGDRGGRCCRACLSVRPSVS